MTVGVLGASGFVGRHLAAALRRRGDTVIAASLRDPATAASSCANADTVVNLAGETIAQRWTPTAKDRIRRSRVAAPRTFLEALAARGTRPSVYISASAIGYYGTSWEATFTETSPAGDDFLAQVCVDWEREANRAANFGMRVAIVRTGVVLGSDGGALARLLPIFRGGAGGIVASGRQWYSWVHIDDVVGIYLAAIDGAGGALNATAPTPVRNAEFTAALARAVHRPAILPVPAFAIKLLLGDGAIVVTRGQRVLPERTLAQGYAFQYAAIERAFAQIAKPA
ncbi:MAG: TIGR01777 family oxidoreductase [Vulcanimicrobiaceae bacterium]